jgi:twitching motility protein PilT
LSKLSDLKKILTKLIEDGASDLHLSVDSAPHIRVDEKLVPCEYDPLSGEDIRALLYPLLSEAQKKSLEKELELDMSFGLKDKARFRANIFYQRGNIGAAIRALPAHIMSFEECGLPVNVMIDLCKMNKGLVLVTGATGSGKSTTLASMVEFINNDRPVHIVTIEDPIEYIYTGKKAVIDQREVGHDTHSFANALKHVLRQDPDVILIGEMRDLESIELALNAAETGHLVLATLHTSDSAQTINRIIDVFPQHQQEQVRVQLSFVLKSILAQQLIPKPEGRGRSLGLEVLMMTPAVRSLIREQKVHQIYSVIQTSQKEGMRTMNQSLYELYRMQKISYEEAISRTNEVDDLKRMLKSGV